jgi:hypothetical protein
VRRKRATSSSSVNPVTTVGQQRTNTLCSPYGKKSNGSTPFLSPSSRYAFPCSVVAGIFFLSSSCFVHKNVGSDHHMEKDYSVGCFGLVKINKRRLHGNTKVAERGKPRAWSYLHFFKGPRSRCYGRSAALRLLVQPCDEDERWSVFLNFLQVMEHRWNKIDRGKPKYSGKNLSQCHFVHHKSHMGWPGIDSGPPLWSLSLDSVKSIQQKHTLRWFYRCPDHSGCHGMSQQVQTFCTIKLSCLGKCKKRLCTDRNLIQLILLVHIYTKVIPKYFGYSQGIGTRVMFS